MRHALSVHFRCARFKLLITMLALSMAWPAAWARSNFQDDKASVQDLKRLQGTWFVTEAERDGQALDRIKGNKLIVKDNQFTVVTTSAELKGDLTLDAGKTPKRLDMQHQEGLLRDKKWEAIYKLDGDKLTICYTEADTRKDRPDEFATRNGTNRLLIVLERKKP